jgi:hypothetical protein
MKYWIRLLALFGCVILLFALLGSLLPHGYSFSSTVTINASQEQVFELIEDLPKWKKWSQWNADEIADLTVEYSSDGKTQKWTDVRGEGKLWITDQKAPEQLDYEMRFASFPTMKSSFVLAPADMATEVTLSSEGVLPSGPFYGFFRGVFVSGMQRQYESSLAKLKKVAEEGGATQDADSEENVSEPLDESSRD